MIRLRLCCGIRPVDVLAVHVVALLTLPLLADATAAEEQVRVAKPAPAFVLKNLEGNDVKSSDFKDQALIVVFLASWDKHCRTQVPILIELQRQHGGTEFSVIGISVDNGPEIVKRFVEQEKINFPMLMFDLKVIQDFGGLNAIPTSYLIDSNHNIIHKHVGWVEKDELEKDLKVILKK